MSGTDYVIRVLASPLQIDAVQWNELLRQQTQPTPFLRHEYLVALHDSGSATPATGWTPRFVTLWQIDAAQGEMLAAACPLYLKPHSRGEYVFDWAWADAYARHGVAYYPKGVVAVPFTPVPGSRLLARDPAAREALLHAVLDECREQGLSSLHLLFASDDDLQTCERAGLTLRHTLQFHWRNGTPAYVDFDAFLGQLTQDKRKKVRQEQRKVREAGVSYRWSLGGDITPRDWDFFYRCYVQTYAEHGNPPYLSPDFFLDHMAQTMPEHWLLIVAERQGRPIACSLIAVDATQQTAYGRYWGALERVDCLHFDLCYYQPLRWCIDHGYRRFEGGAQGEHKLARALLPVRASSAHWLAHPAFADAISHALNRERQAVDGHLAELARHSPFKQSG